MQYQTVVLKDGSIYYNVQKIIEHSTNFKKLLIGYTRIINTPLVSNDSIAEIKVQPKYIAINQRSKSKI